MDRQYDTCCRVRDVGVIMKDPAGDFRISNVSLPSDSEIALFVDRAEDYFPPPLTDKQKEEIDDAFAEYFRRRMKQPTRTENAKQLQGSQMKVSSPGSGTAGGTSTSTPAGAGKSSPA